MDLTIRIARRFPCAAVQCPLSVVRFHSSYSNGSDRLRSRWQDQTRLMRHHLAVRDKHRPGLAARQRLLSKHNGWYHLFLEQTRRPGATRQEKRAAVSYALRTSPLHTLKSRTFWRLIGGRQD